MGKSLDLDIDGKKVVHAGQIEVIHGKVIDKPVQYTIVELTKADIQTMLYFQNIILHSLKEEEKSYFNEKSKGFLTKHFNQGSKAIALVCDGHLLGQALLVHPTQLHPKTGMTDMADVGAPETVSVIQGLGVHPMARGMKIGDKLIKAWMDVAKDDNREHVIAETEQNNVYSWSLFVKNGVDIVSEAEDPSDGAQLYNHHKKLTL